MRKLLHTILTLIFFFAFADSKAQVTIGAVDPGPYGYGGSITVPISFPGNQSGFPSDNTFELFLSDATGNFAGNGTRIGTYSGFYAPAINGVIPGAPLVAGTGYKLRIRSSNPDNNPVATVTDVPGTITISAVTSSVVTLTQSAPGNSLLTGDNLGFCPPESGDNKSANLQSNATGITTVTMVVTNLATGVSTNYAETPTGVFVENLAKGTYAVKVITSTLVGVETIKSIRTYTLYNNPILVNIQDIGQSAGCLNGLGGGASISFGITVVSSTGGIADNYPGVVYRVDWGDGTTSDLTIADIVNNSSRITHSYTRTSCGQPNIPGGPPNSFNATITATSPICGIIASTTGYAQIYLNPVAEITPVSTIGCVGIPMTFNNTSRGGTRFNCSTQMDYTWYLDGNVVQRSTTAEPYIYRNPTAGPHIIKLVASNGVGSCLPSEFPLSICVQLPSRASFTLPGAVPVTICANTTLIPTNTSFIDNTCTTARNFRWIIDIVTAGGPVQFANSTSLTSETPEFIFSVPGVYDISLAIPNPTCGEVVTQKQRVVVNKVPTATLSQNVSLCTPGPLVFDSSNPLSPTYTTVSGTFNDLPDTYTWTVTGGNYTITNNDLHTKFPTITFQDFATYTITLQHTNNCGSASLATQVITFIPSPVITLPTEMSICYTDVANLNATVTPGTYTIEWRSSGTGTFSDRTILNPVYTPSAQDKNSSTHQVLLTIKLTTNLADPCKTIEKSILVKIKPEILITSAPTKSICTGDPLGYQPTANITATPTTYSWTATGSANASGFANGTGTVINDALVNSDLLNNATVTYVITPTNDGCNGVPFTLTVTVTPKPILTPVADKTICSNQSAAIPLVSNLGPTTRYIWTSIATNGATNTITGNSNPPTAASVTAINDVLINNGTTQGTVTYVITPVSAMGCSGAPVTVVITVDPALTVANAGPAESICDVSIYTLKGNRAVVGTGTWTLTSGQTGVTILFPNQENSGLEGLVGGQSYTFEWRISSAGACAPTVSTVVITVNIPTVAGTTATADPATVCEAANTGTITLSGNTGAVLRWESSIDGGTTWLPIANTTTTLTYTNITVATQYRAVVQNGSCDIKTSAATNILVTRATTVALAGVDQTLCAQTTTVLNGNLPNSGDIGTWTLVSGPATVTFNASDPKTPVTGLVPGQNYTFRWTIAGLSPCGPTFDEVTITDLPPLTNTITSTSTEVCYGQVINITGSTPTGGDGTYTYTWEVSPDGTNWSVIAGETAKDLNYTLLATSSFRRTVLSNTCPLVSNVINIIAQPPIGNNTIAADQTLCTGLVPLPLTGSVPTGSDGNYLYQWQSSLDNSNWTNINGAVFKDYAPLALTATTYFRRLVSTNFCTGSLNNISAAVTITIKPDAKAEYTYTKDKDCTPFVIDANNIKAVPYPDRNASYAWYADGTLIGNTITFPGYTISASDQSVTIKLVATPSQACQPNEFSHVFSTNQSVAASYTQSATEGCGPLVVNFVNTSTSLTGATFRWDFGNGTTSSQTMPAAVTFLPDPTGKDITYTVTLTATTTCGTNSITSTVFVKAKPIAVFSPSKTVGCSPMTVTFTNTSPGGTNTYYYDFGDGTLLTKTDKSPVEHTFITNAVKDFVVTMIAENECGRDQSSYTIRVSPNTVLPELVVNANEKEGCAPFKVNFYNNSRGANLFKYDFGDGATVITRSAPEVVAHTFTTPGTYTITLTASNGCSDTTTTESITVLPQPLAAFTADNTLGCPGLVVQFKNTTTDGVSYIWDFGDGTTSTEFEPKHVYTGDQEFYTVNLTATNSLGCTYTAIMNEYIHIVSPPVAKFNVAPSTLISIPNYTFRFEDESTNNPTIWAWDFGDGIKSTLQNPSHTYLDTGSYIVTLRVSNQQGCFTTTFKTVTIVGVPGYLYVPNSFMPGSETPELRVFMAKGSGIKTWNMSVFNKWGQSLWQTTKLDEGRPVEWWDGTFNSVPVPQGVYFWKIDVEFINGTAWKGVTYDSKAPKKTGVIHLIR